MADDFWIIHLVLAKPNPIFFLPRDLHGLLSLQIRHILWKFQFCPYSVPQGWYEIRRREAPWTARSAAGLQHPGVRKRRGTEGQRATEGKGWAIAVRLQSGAGRRAKLLWAHSRLYRLRSLQVNTYLLVSPSIFWARTSWSMHICRLNAKVRSVR